MQKLTLKVKQVTSKMKLICHSKHQTMCKSASDNLKAPVSSDKPCDLNTQHFTLQTQNNQTLLSALI